MEKEKVRDPGGDKIISGARTIGRICEKICGYSLTTFALVFLAGLISNGVADAKISYNKRKEGRNG